MDKQIYDVEVKDSRQPLVDGARGGHEDFGGASGTVCSVCENSLRNTLFTCAFSVYMLY